MTTTIASERRLQWRTASKSDVGIVKTFLDAGGSGSASIDRFAREDLAQHASERYSNTHLLLNQEGGLVAFASNSMGTVSLNDQEMMEYNMPVVSHEVPVMFLHRVGVLRKHHRKGLGSLLVWRVFEALRHVCDHTAAIGIALLVESANTEARELYVSKGFQLVNKQKRGLELMILPYPEAMEQMAILGRKLRDLGAQKGGA